MCKYCGKNETIFEMESISDSAWGWGFDGTKISLAEAHSNTDIAIVFIDRGYLRLVDKHDCNCLDNGKRAKLNFCPFCGTSLIND